MECAVRVCLYLKSTQDFRLGGPRTESNEFKYYPDSDFAGDRELTKNSRSGGIPLPFSPTIPYEIHLQTQLF